MWGKKPTNGRSHFGATQLPIASVLFEGDGPMRRDRYEVDEVIDRKLAIVRRLMTNRRFSSACKGSVALASFALGCGAPAPKAPAEINDAAFAAQFPTSADLTTLANTPPPAAPRKPTAFVDAWSITASIPASGEVEGDASGALGALVSASAAARAGAFRHAAALDCAASEDAKFIADHGAPPSEPLQRFITLRCGGSTVGARMQWLIFDREVRDEALLAKSADVSIRVALGNPSGGSVRAGIGFAVGGGKTVVALAFDDDRSPITLSPLPAEGSARTVTVSGKRPEGVTQLRAFINAGTHGVGRCTAAPAPAGAYAFECTVADGDHQALLQVAALPTNGMLLVPVGFALAHDDTEGSRRWATTIATGRVPAADEGAVRQQIHTRINAVRAEAGLSPLALLAEQSDANAKLVGAFTGASSRGEHVVAEKIALGVIAGWDVGAGMIRNAELFASTATPAVDGDGWVADALDTPLARGALLEPAMSSIAIGTSTDAAHQAISAIASTYAFFAPGVSAPLRGRLLADLAAQRKLRGLAPPKLLADDRPLARAAQAIRAEGASLKDALDGALGELVASRGTSMRGRFVAAANPEALALDESLIAKPNLTLAIAVTERPIRGTKWGEWVVLVAWIDEAGEPAGAPVRTATANVSEG